MADDHSFETLGTCCGSCQNTSLNRPRFVIGVFAHLNEAAAAADRLSATAAGNVNVVSSVAPMVAQEPCGLTGLSLMRCGRLYQEVNHHLESGAVIVVVEAKSPEQQLGVSRVLLESKCAVLLTHDGSRDVA